MLPLIMAGAGAGLGLLKSEFIDKDNENKDREMQSITDRYSPWTGMRGKMVDHTNPLGSAMAFGAHGAALGQGFDKSAADNALTSSMADKMNAAGSVPSEGLATPADAPIQYGSTKFGPGNDPAIIGGMEPSSGPANMSGSDPQSSLFQMLMSNRGNRKAAGFSGTV